MIIRGALTAILTAAMSVSAIGTAAAAEPIPAAASCPTLQVFGIQGTGESALDADPKTDTGALGLMFRPMMSAASGLIDRTYVPYEASFGGATAGGPVPYSQSVANAMGRLDAMVTEMAKRCPGSMFAGAGYSQGAHAMSLWAKRVGAGDGPIPADRVAAVALFADPARPPGAPVFPGRTGARSPEPAPGTGGAAVSKITVTDPGLRGGGIGPIADLERGYGDLSGRVADFCAAGDLACDAPEHAPVVHLIANIAGQSQLNPQDPIASISTLAQALATTSFKTAVKVVNEDVHGTSLDQISYRPGQSISQRLALASDPRTPLPTVDEALSALLKVGTIAFNAVQTVAMKVFTPSTIAQLATVGLADPLAAAAVLGTKVAAAVVELVPPATQSRLVNEAFTALRENVTDNRDLFNIATLVRYSQMIARHEGYGSIPASPSGQSPTAVAAEWFAAAARDLAGAR